MKKITVFCEVDLIKKELDKVSYELISKAYELAQNAKQLTDNKEQYIVEAVCLADELDRQFVQKAFLAGANRFVFIKDDSLGQYCHTIYANCFNQYFKENQSEIIIFPATYNGRMLAPRITASLETGLVADCTGLDFILKDDQLKFAPTRPTFGAELMATILSKKNPQCATIRPNTFKSTFDKDIEGEYVEFKPISYEENRIKLLRTILDRKTNPSDFTNAKIVLAGGYGLASGKDKIYFEKLAKIAQVIGAKVGSTRKVVDLGLMKQETQIGLTGSYVEAQLYIAFGISGAIQHITGMKNSKCIVSVNTDENAEIFKYSDYKVVADAKKIIDELYQKIV